MAATGWKWAVIIANSLMLAMGVVIAAVSIWVLAADDGRVQFSKIEDNGEYSEGFSKVGLLEVGSVDAIVVGTGMVLIAITAFIGCWREYKFIFGLCIGFLIFLILLDIITIIVTGIMRQRIDDGLRAAIVSGIKYQYQGVISSDNPFSVKFDRFQVEYECCGVNSPFDFQNYSRMWVDQNNLLVPKTCCFLDKDKYLDDGEFVYDNIDCATDLSLKMFHTKSCVDDLKDWLVDKTNVVIGIVVFIMVYKLLVLFLNWALMRRVRDGLNHLYDNKKHGRLQEEN